MAIQTGGMRTPATQMNSNKLYWMAFQNPVTARIGNAHLRPTAGGGLRVTDPSAAARVMSEIYSGQFTVPEGLDLPKVDNATAMKIRSDVTNLTAPADQRLHQRLFDSRSSYDLRVMAELVYKVLWRTGFGISDKELSDSAMTKLLQLPGCSILGCTLGPTFELSAEKNPDLLVYDAGKFAPETFVFDRTADRFELDTNGIVHLSKNGGPSNPAILPYAFPFVMSEAGLSGLRMTMTQYDPRTAIGGMGFSNNLSRNAVENAMFLLNTGADIGTLFSMGGFLEKFRFGRETGFQEAQQITGGGHVLVANAPGIFGGMARRLDLSVQHDAIKDNMHLVLFNRPAANVARHPINDTWVLQAGDEAFEHVYMDQFAITAREVAPYLAASNGGTLDFDELVSAFRAHSIRRWKCCPAYHGNSEQAAFIKKVHDQGGAAFPLGEGGEKAAMLVILEPNAYNALGLKELTVDDAAKTEGSITGEIKYDLLDEMPRYGKGYQDLAATGKYGFARPALELVDYSS
jgi:hypothetical protein